jgi:asparagine synthase (glutamine-hydrolysing)
VQRQINGFDLKKVMTRVFTFHPGLSYVSPEDHIANSLYFEAKTFLHGLMIVGDRLSLAHGLEERTPFLDNDLVDFAQRIPVRLKLKNLEQWKRLDENELPKRREYYALHDDGKAVLRAAVSSLVPPQIRDRPKQGFSSPDENWYRGANLEFVRNLIMNKRALCHDFIAPCKIRRIMEQHCSRKANHRLLIWSLTNFELWLRIFLDGQMGVMAAPNHRRPFTHQRMDGQGSGLALAS